MITASRKQRVRLERLDLRKCGAAVPRLANELQVRAILHGAHYAFAVERVIVGDQDPDALLFETR